MREGLVETPVAVGDLTVEHGGGHREDVAAGVVEQVPRLRHPRAGLDERGALGMGLSELAGGRQGDTTAIVNRGRRGAVEVPVAWQWLCDQLLPSAEPHQHVGP